MTGREHVEPTYDEAFDAAPDESEAVYDPDAPRVDPSREASNDVDQSAVPPFEAALNEAVDSSGGRYQDDDRTLVMAALSQGEMPSQVGPREMPALAREWLEAALGLRGADESPAITLLDRMTREGSRTAARMAKRTLERLAALELARVAAARMGKR